MNLLEYFKMHIHTNNNTYNMYKNTELIIKSDGEKDTYKSFYAIPLSIYLNFPESDNVNHSLTYTLYRVKNLLFCYYIYHSYEMNGLAFTNITFKKTSFEDGISAIASIRISSKNDCIKVFKEFYATPSFTEKEIKKLKFLESKFINIYS